MINILVAAHDPGGANLINSIVHSLSKDLNYNLYLILLGPARQVIKLKSSNIIYLDCISESIYSFPNERSIDEKIIIDLFDNNKFDIALTATSWNSNLEKLIIKYAKINFIKSFSIVDFWSSYVERFKYKNEVFLPNIIFVMDKKMEKDIKKTICSKTKIIVSGNPYLYQLSQEIKHVSFPDNKAQNIIRFFSENIKHYHPQWKINEFYIVDKVIDFLQKTNKKLDFIIRPHPMESVEPWTEYILNKHLSNKIKISVERVPLINILKENFIALGISSMALIETSICNIETYSYQIELNKKDYLYIPFNEYNICQIKTEKDLELLLDKKEKKINILKKSVNPMQIIENHIKFVTLND